MDVVVVVLEFVIFDVGVVVSYIDIGADVVDVVVAVIKVDVVVAFVSTFVYIRIKNCFCNRHSDFFGRVVFGM